MSTAPVIGTAGQELDLLIRQGATFGPFECTLSNPDGTPVDLTGATVRGQLRRKALDALPLIALTCTITDAAAGEFTIGLTAAQTAALVAGEDPLSLNSKAVWDLELQDAGGSVTALCYGRVAIHREVTR